MGVKTPRRARPIRGSRNWLFYSRGLVTFLQPSLCGKAACLHTCGPQGPTLPLRLAVQPYHLAAKPTCPEGLPSAQAPGPLGPRTPLSSSPPALHKVACLSSNAGQLRPSWTHDFSVIQRPKPKAPCLARCKLLPPLSFLRAPRHNGVPLFLISLYLSSYPLSQLMILINSLCTIYKKKRKRKNKKKMTM